MLSRLAAAGQAGGSQAGRPAVLERERERWYSEMKGFLLTLLTTASGLELLGSHAGFTITPPEVGGATYTYMSVVRIFDFF